MSRQQAAHHATGRTVVVDTGAEHQGDGGSGSLGHGGHAVHDGDRMVDAAERVDQLVDALVERLGPRIAELVAAAAFGALVDAPTAARLLSVPESWLRAEARADRVPHVPLGKYVRFDPVELMAWARGRSVGPRASRTGAHPVSKLRDAA